jgi:hypothetical protein
MDVSANQSAGPAGPGSSSALPGIRRSTWRRRPSGQPPPLPHHLQTTGVGWLIAAVVLVVLSVLVFAGGLHGLAVDITVVDAGLVGWAAGLRAPGLLTAMQTLAALGSYLAITALLWGLLLALLVLRRALPRQAELQRRQQLLGQGREGLELLVAYGVIGDHQRCALRLEHDQAAAVAFQGADGSSWASGAELMDRHACWQGGAERRRSAGLHDLAVQLDSTAAPDGDGGWLPCSQVGVGPEPCHPALLVSGGGHQSGRLPGVVHLFRCAEADPRVPGRIVQGDAREGLSGRLASCPAVPGPTEPARVGRRKGVGDAEPVIQIAGPR